MQSEAVVVRERSAWEAIDSGIILLRSHLEIYRNWGLLMTPFVVIATLISGKSPWLGIAVIWFCKPIADRAAVLSFGEVMIGKKRRALEILKAAVSTRPLAIFSELTWFRFLPWCMYILPVRMLERQRGKGFSARSRIIRTEWLWHASAVRIAVLCIEWGAFFGFAVMAEWLFSVDFFSSAARGGNHILSLLLLFMYTVAVGLSAPFHAASGFGLYINRRIRIEGWDLERSFKSMAERISRSAKSRRRGRVDRELRKDPTVRGATKLPGIFAVFFLGAFLFGPGTPSMPADELPVGELPAKLHKAVTPEEYRTLQGDLEEIMEQKQFQEYETAVRWRWKGGPDERKAWNPDIPGLGIMEDLLRRFNTILPWIAGGVILVLLFLTYLRYGPWLTEAILTRKKGKTGPSPVRQESSPGPQLTYREEPAGFAGRALEGWQRGRKRMAVETLYFGALCLLERKGKLRLPLSATEEERCRFFEKNISGDRLPALFRSTTGVWQRWAYGETLPGEDEFRRQSLEWEQAEAEK